MDLLLRSGLRRSDLTSQTPSKKQRLSNANEKCGPVDQTTEKDLNTSSEQVQAETTDQTSQNNQMEKDSNAANEQTPTETIDQSAENNHTEKESNATSVPSTATDETTPNSSSSSPSSSYVFSYF